MRNLLLIITALLILSASAIAGPSLNLPIKLDVLPFASVAYPDGGEDPEIDFGALEAAVDPDAQTLNMCARGNQAATVAIAVAPEFPFSAELQPQGGGAAGNISVSPGETLTWFWLVVDCERISYDMDPDADWNSNVIVAITMP